MDQYANETIPDLWGDYIGDSEKRTNKYIHIIDEIFKKNNVNSVLDLSCGTGVDSIALIKLGYDVTSIDLSKDMIKKTKEIKEFYKDVSGFKDWEIRKLNWLDLNENTFDKKFDAAICLGNSFSHLLDKTKSQENHKKALKNFKNSLKKKGILIIDHRNFDYILENQKAPISNIYYDGKTENIDIEFKKENNKVKIVQFNYCMEGLKFELQYYPHKLVDFTNLLINSLNIKDRENLEILYDYQPTSNKECGFIQYIVKNN